MAILFNPLNNDLITREISKIFGLRESAACYHFLLLIINYTEIIYMKNNLFLFHITIKKMEF